jgi:uncharacterized protein GlcG (DUF336 family)
MKGENDMGNEKLPRRWPPELSYDYSGMNLEKAVIMVDAAREKAKEIGIGMTLTVCDAAGNLVVLQRMDDAALVSLEIAVNKARTAVYGKIPTGEWATRFKGTDPLIPPLFFHSGWITFGGGYPVIVEGKIIGGIGFSGATWEDNVIARVALKAIGADLSAVEAYLKGAGVPEVQW